MGKYTSNINNNILTFCFEGELDTLACMEFEEELLRSIKSHKGKTCFDMEKVNYIASSFIRLCGSAATFIGSKNLSLLNLNKEIKKNLTRIGLASVLNIE